MSITTRTVAGAAIVAGALTASALTAPAAVAAPLPTSVKPSLAAFTDWNQYGVADLYDYELTTHAGAPALRMSNGIANVANYGNIDQLSSPAIAEVGEPTTGAAYRVFTAEYTIDAADYDAQPGLAVEVSADQGGNRSGGSVVFRVDDDDQLTLSTYWADAGSDAEIEDWNNDTATIDFDGPVAIRYVVEYHAAAPDSVKVYADGVLRLEGEGFEAYHAADGAPAQTVDSLLFRASRNKPVVDGAWIADVPTEEQREALEGNGFFFSGIEYGASNKAYAPSSAVLVDAQLTGTAVVGGTLTVAADTSEPGATVKYQWLREGLAIAGATGTSYVLTANDAGKRISVRVTATKAGHTAGSVTTDKTAPVSTATLAWSVDPEITGTARLGATLTAVATTSPAATYAYQWYRNGAAIKGATAKTYKQTASDVGRVMTVKVTASKAGYATLSAVSDPTAVVLPGVLTPGTVTISGSSKVGGTLSAKTAGWASGVTVKYAFYANGELVQFSADRKLKLTWEEKGKRITVIVTGSKPGYTKTESAESAGRGPIS